MPVTYIDCYLDSFFYLICNLEEYKKINVYLTHNRCFICRAMQRTYFCFFQSAKTIPGTPPKKS